MTPEEALQLLDDLIAADEAYKVARERVKDSAADIFKVTRAALGNVTQRELARRLSVNFTLVSKVEAGAVEPHRPTVAKVAELLRARLGK